jgi:2-polyprenyl-6-hydroxyphenyl methylase/3-demethylubiquinone-9 3-methyltransferase
MAWKKLNTVKCTSGDEILQFFEKSALNYHEAHGDADKLLKYRMSVLTKWADLKVDEVVLDVGCGNGHHLFYLAPLIGHGIGFDFSKNMIKSAKNSIKNSQYAQKLQFQVDSAQQMKTITDNSIDVLICIGSFEHMLKKEKVINQFQRVLKPGGRLVLMTPNGNYYWYRYIAPLFNIQTRHLSTDLFLSAHQLQKKFLEAKFKSIEIDYWTFIPKGDMLWFWGILLEILDRFGQFFRIHSLRGGIILKAYKN